MVRSWEKKTCSSCGSGSVHRHGRTHQGKQRWICIECGRTFIWKNPSNALHRQQVWFKRWIIEGYTYRQISQQSGHSISTIRRIVKHWLNHPPEFVWDISSCRYFILDGTFIERRSGLFVAMNAKDNSVVHGVVDVSEGPADLNRFCRTLTERGARLQSATVDGNPHLTKALRRHWPKITIQRCLVHIQRQGLSWCRRFPKRTDAKHLRKLFLRVASIHTKKDRDQFLEDLYQWEAYYGYRVAEKPERGHVFSDLKRARSMLLAAAPDMFHYLDDSGIPKSTNGLEGYFGRLKQKYRQHRGLAKHNRKAYFLWYFYLCPR